MEQVILDHSPHTPSIVMKYYVNKPKYPDSFNLVSLFGLFPNFIFDKDKSELSSGRSKYDFTPGCYGTEINWEKEGKSLYLNDNHQMSGRYYNGRYEGLWKIIYHDGKIIHNHFRNGISYSTELWDINGTHQRIIWDINGTHQRIDATQ